MNPRIAFLLTFLLLIMASGGLKADSLSLPFPNDPMLEDQGWIGFDGEIDIGILEAWEMSTGSPAVTVAIIDTGIDLDHPDLEGNLWTNEGEIPDNGIDDDGNGYIDDRHGFNFRDGNNDVQDENNHGSHLAGVIGAIGNNGIGVAGVNWKVRLMPLKFTDAEGNGKSVWAIKAINYAIENGAQIINASWTLKPDEPGSAEDNSLREAIRKAGEAGILFVTAAGNQFETGIGLNLDEAPVYPAAFSLENLIAVGALDEKGERATFSNFGPETVSLFAPGSGILSTFSEGGYGVMTGTSVSTAFVSGFAALLLSINPDLSPGEMKSLLEGSGVLRFHSPEEGSPSPALSVTGGGCSLISTSPI